MILVTGGAGFIGANFILQWRNNCNEAVINLDALTYAGNPDNLATLAADEQHQLVQGDITDARLLEQLMDEYQPRAIIHFAAESHVDRSILGPQAFIHTNVNGTFTLLEAARSYWSHLNQHDQAAFRFVHVSTDEVYGTLSPEAPAFTEETAYAPNSPYSASKAASDHLVRAYFHTYGLPVLTTSCSNNYGPFQFPEKLIPLLITHALKEQPLPVYGDGQQVRDWLYVEDHCRAISRVLEAGTPGEVYNIGGWNEHTNLDIVQRVCGLLDELSPRAGNTGGYASLITHVADRPGHDRRYAINAEKIQRTLGWAPQETFDTGLRKTVQWYLDNLTWCEKLQDRQSPPASASQPRPTR